MQSEQEAEALIFILKVKVIKETLKWNFKSEQYDPPNGNSVH